MADVSDAKRRLLRRLKLVESATAPELAAEFGLTDTAVRQHLDALAEVGLVERSPSAPSGRGRPPAAWRLTGATEALFPDRHGDLAVELLGAARDRYGRSAVDELLTARSSNQVTLYRHVVGDGDLAERTRRLAEQRSLEGYIAESRLEADGSISLVEHHCPIADAARSCDDLCRHELNVIRTVLGDGVIVERTHHLLAGDRRCAYTVRPTWVSAAPYPHRSSGGNSLGPT